MIRQVLFLIIALLAIIFGPIASGHKGYVLISLAQWTVEMSVVSFVLSLLMLFFVVSAGEWGVRKLLRMSNRSFDWFSGRKSRNAQQQTSEGLLALSAQDWVQAEKLLSKSAKHSHSPALNYLAAAEAAKQQGREQQQQQYLGLVADTGEQSLPIALAKARLASQPAELLESCDELQQWLSKKPKHGPLLQQLSQLFVQLQRWSELRELLPKLRKYTQLDALQLEQLQWQSVAGEFALLTAEQNQSAVEQLWGSLAKPLRKQARYLALYSQAMRSLGQGAVVVDEVFKMLCQQPEEALLVEWLQLPVDQSEQRLRVVKKLKQHNQGLYPCLLAFTAMHAKHWDDAVLALEKRLQQDDCLVLEKKVLADIYQQQGDESKALGIYQQLVH